MMLMDRISRYNCNRYDEKEAQAARDAQAVSYIICNKMTS